MNNNLFNQLIKNKCPFCNKQINIFCNEDDHYYFFINNSKKDFGFLFNHNGINFSFFSSNPEILCTKNKPNLNLVKNIIDSKKNISVYQLDLTKLKKNSDYVFSYDGLLDLDKVNSIEEIKNIILKINSLVLFL